MMKIKCVQIISEKPKASDIKLFHENIKSNNYQDFPDNIEQKTLYTKVQMTLKNMITINEFNKIKQNLNESKIKEKNNNSQQNDSQYVKNKLDLNDILLPIFGLNDKIDDKESAFLHHMKHHINYGFFDVIYRKFTIDNDLNSSKNNEAKNNSEFYYGLKVINQQLVKQIKSPEAIYENYLCLFQQPLVRLCKLGNTKISIENKGTIINRSWISGDILLFLVKTQEVSYFKQQYQPSIQNYLTENKWSDGAQKIINDLEEILLYVGLLFTADSDSIDFELFGNISDVEKEKLYSLKNMAFHILDHIEFEISMILQENKKQLQAALANCKYGSLVKEISERRYKRINWFKPLSSDFPEHMIELYISKRDKKKEISRISLNKGVIINRTIQEDIFNSSNILIAILYFPNGGLKEYSEYFNIPYFIQIKSIDNFFIAIHQGIINKYQIYYKEKVLCFQNSEKDKQNKQFQNIYLNPPQGLSLNTVDIIIESNKNESQSYLKSNVLYHDDLDLKIKTPSSRYVQMNYGKQFYINMTYKSKNWPIKENMTSKEIEDNTHLRKEKSKRLTNTINKSLSLLNDNELNPRENRIIEKNKTQSLSPLIQAQTFNASTTIDQLVTYLIQKKTTYYKEDQIKENTEIINQSRNEINYEQLGIKLIYHNKKSKESTNIILGSQNYLCVELNYDSNPELYTKIDNKIYDTIKEFCANKSANNKKDKKQHKESFSLASLSKRKWKTITDKYLKNYISYADDNIFEIDISPY